MATKTKSRSKKIAEHPHRWNIETPNGPESRGECTVCGKTKMFKNWQEQTQFVTDRSKRAA